MKKKKGYFMTFEGTEGSGKSTQIRRVVQYLKQLGYRVHVLREPGGTRVSEAIRRILLNKTFKEMSDQTELLLYLAARAQVVQEKILPALRRGEVVICDRFEESTLAYQGYGRNIPLSHIYHISRLFVRGLLRPDLVFLLDVDPRKGMKRGGRRDRIEHESYQFHQRVRQGYLAMARRESGRFVILRALDRKEVIAKKIKDRIDRVLGKN